MTPELIHDPLSVVVGTAIGVIAATIYSLLKGVNKVQKEETDGYREVSAMLEKKFELFKEQWAAEKLLFEKQIAEMKHHAEGLEARIDHLTYQVGFYEGIFKEGLKLYFEAHPDQALAQKLPKEANAQ